VKENHLRIADFFAKEYRRMTGYVRSIIEDSSDWESEDIIQDVMTGIFEAADITRPIENLSAYIYRSLRNRVTDKMRIRKNTLSLDAPDPETGISFMDTIKDDRYDIAEGIIMDEIRNAFFNSVENLPDEMKTVFIMTEFEGKTFRKISEETGVPVNSLLSRKSRALDRIRVELNQYKMYMEK